MGKGPTANANKRAHPAANRGHTNAGKHPGGGDKRDNADLRKNMMAVATGGQPAHSANAQTHTQRTSPSLSPGGTPGRGKNLKQQIGNVVAEHVAKASKKQKELNAQEFDALRKNLPKEVETAVKAYIASYRRDNPSSADSDVSADEIRQARSSLRSVMDALKLLAHVRIEAKPHGDGTARERKFLSFATVKQGHAFAEFLMNYASRLSSLPALVQRLKGCARIAAENYPTVWQEIEAFATRLKEYKGDDKDASPPEYELCADAYERIADFVAAFAVHHLRSVIPFGTIVLALTLRDFELQSVPTAALRKMHDDPWACPNLAKIHNELHAYFMKELPKQSTKHDLYGWKTTAFPEFNIVQANTAKPTACPVHAPNVKCDITFV